MGWTVLHEAVIVGKYEIVKWLLEDTEVDVDAKDCEGRTALYLAARRWEVPQFELMKLLIEVGKADIHSTAKNGMSVLDVVERGSVPSFLMQYPEAGYQIVHSEVD
jgi:ankyrin repeat protein